MRILKFVPFILVLTAIMGSCKKDCDFISDSHLVAYYSFNGNALDSTTYHNDGQVNNAVLTTDRFGRENRAYSFDGESSYIFIPNSTSLDLKESFTLSAWVRPEITSGSMVIVWRGDEQPARDPYVFGFTDNTIGIRRDAGDGSEINISSYALKATFSGKWFNFIGTYNAISKTAKLYIDGTLVKQDTFKNGTIGYSTEGFWNIIGALDHGTGALYNGKIDEVRIYNIALTDKEIESLALLYN